MFGASFSHRAPGWRCRRSCLAAFSMVGVGYLVAAAVLLMREPSFFVDATNFLFAMASGVALPGHRPAGPSAATDRLRLPTTYALDILRIHALGTTRSPPSRSSGSRSSPPRCSRCGSASSPSGAPSTACASSVRSASTDSERRLDWLGGASDDHRLDHRHRARQLRGLRPLRRHPARAATTASSSTTRASCRASRCAGRQASRAALDGHRRPRAGDLLPRQPAARADRAEQPRRHARSRGHRSAHRAHPPHQLRARAGQGCG